MKDEDKTKEQLLRELSRMRQELAKLRKTNSERKQVKHDLDERIKELSCIYGIAHIVDKPNITLGTVYRQVTNLLPSSWQYPEIVCARIAMDGKEFKTVNYKETDWKQSSKIRVDGEKVGVVEVCYLDKKSEIDGEPFLKEEQYLIDAVAELLGKITERKLALDKLKHLNEMLHAIRKIDRLLIEEKHRDRLLKGICDTLVKEHVYHNVCITLLGESCMFVGMPETDLEKDSPLTILRLKLSELTDCGRKAVADSGVLISDYALRVQGDCAVTRTSPDKEALTARLEYQGKIYGVLCVSIDKDLTEDEEEQSLLRLIADDVAVALHHLEIEEERRQAAEIRAKQAAALVAKAEELQQSRQRIVNVQESLRKEIAQELHGAVQSRLIVVLHRLTDLAKLVPQGEPAAEVRYLKEKMEEILENHVRPIGRRLFPSILYCGLIPALQSLGDQLEANTVVAMKLDEELVRQEKNDRKFIPEAVRLAMYRIAGEALTNVVKHTKASEVDIALELSSKRWLRLIVRDNGQRCNVGSDSSGIGLIIMQDYAKVLGGECVIRNAPGEGTEVTATLPLAGLDAEHAGRDPVLE